MDRKQYLKNYQIQNKKKFIEYQKNYLQKLNSDPEYIKEKKIQRRNYYLENKEKFKKYQYASYSQFYWNLIFMKIFNIKIIYYRKVAKSEIRNVNQRDGPEKVCQQHQK